MVIGLHQLVMMVIIFCITYLFHFLLYYIIFPGLIRLIDVRTGKLLKQFSEHIFPVTSIRFHPSEYLLCSGGTDGVLNFYDLEKFTVVSKTDNNVGNISTMAFSKNGECLYVATDDYLKVYAWEPARLLDRERIKWGCVSDLALTDNQMVSFCNKIFY